MCTYICTGVSKNSRSFAVYEHKESSLVWLDPFLVQSVYHLPYLAKSSLHGWICHIAIYMCQIIQQTHNCMQHMLHTASYYFHLELRSSYVYSYLLQLRASIYLSLAARTIHNIHGSYSYNFSISSCSESVLLLNLALHLIHQVNFREILCSCLVRPIYNGEPQSNIMQHPRINFAEL